MRFNYLCVQIMQKMQLWHVPFTLAGGPHFPGQWSDLPHPVSSDRTLPRPPSPSPRLALPAEALHQPTELLIAAVDARKHKLEAKGNREPGTVSATEIHLRPRRVEMNPRTQVEWLSPQTGTDRASRCGKENCGCTRMLHEDCYFVLYQTKSISDRHLVEHYRTYSKTN